MSGSVFTSWAGEGWQGSNLSEEQKAAGLQEIGKLVKLWDVNGTVGGPIARDKLWFFWTGRSMGTRNYVAGIFRNKNAGDITKWTYDPDSNDQSIDDNTTNNSSIRLTWQASPRNKVAVWWDEQKTCQSCTGGGFSGRRGSERWQRGRCHRKRTVVTTTPFGWRSSNGILRCRTDCFSRPRYGLGPNAWFGDKQRKEGYNPELIEVQENAGVIPGLSYRGQDAARNYGYMGTYRGSALVRHRSPSLQGRWPAAADRSGLHQLLQQLPSALTSSPAAFRCS